MLFFQTSLKFSSFGLIVLFYSFLLLSAFVFLIIISLSCLCDIWFFFSQKLKATISQQLPQVTNGDGIEVQSSAVTYTANPASPAPTPTPTPAPAVILTAAPQLPTTEETSTHSLQQPATSTTETPVRTHVLTTIFIKLRMLQYRKRMFVSDFEIQGLFFILSSPIFVHICFKMFIL